MYMYACMYGVVYMELHVVYTEYSQLRDRVIERHTTQHSQ